MPALTPEQRSTRARLAARVKHGHDQESVDQARHELARARARADVARWRGLTAEERAELAVLLLTPGGGDAT